MSNTLSASAKGATFLILTQVGSRALTFIINQVLLRYLSPELLGAATQLELYLISVQYFARESLRVALQRQTGNSQAIVNVSYISVALGLPLAYFLARLYARSLLPQVQYMEQSLPLYGIAAILELVTEPCFVVVQQKMMYKIRATAETMATIGRCLITFAAVLWAARTGKDLGVLPFALGQLGYSVLLLLIYYSRTLRIATQESFSLIPKRIKSECVLSTARMYYISPLKYPSLLQQPKRIHRVLHLTIPPNTRHEPDSPVRHKVHPNPRRRDPHHVPHNAPRSRGIRPSIELRRLGRAHALPTH